MGQKKCDLSFNSNFVKTVRYFFKKTFFSTKSFLSLVVTIHFWPWFLLQINLISIRKIRYFEERKMWIYSDLGDFHNLQPMSNETAHMQSLHNRYPKHPWLFECLFAYDSKITYGKNFWNKSKKIVIVKTNLFITTIFIEVKTNLMKQTIKNK